MTDITKWEFEGKAIRTVIVDGETHWMAMDVCEVLDLVTKNPLKSLDEDERGKITEFTYSPDPPNGRSGEIPRTYATISEPGLYKLIMRSRKPAAKRFARWVAHEVLPSIRRTGGYVVPGHEEAFASHLLELLSAQNRTIEALAVQVKALTEWRTDREREHPYGLLGRRDAKVLRGIFTTIRDKRLQLEGVTSPTPSQRLSAYRRVDDAVRRDVGYRNERGASWESATQAQGTAAFSAALRLSASVDKEIAKRKADKAKRKGPSQTVIPFPEKP